MNLYENIYPYIINNKFSNGLTIEMKSFCGEYIGRMEYIESLVKHKKIIHLGCLDHLGLIERKRKENKWFHDRLSKVTKECLGIDINLKGINEVKKRYNINNVIYGDIAKSSISQIKDSHWDFIVIPDVLEHIYNPALFLKNLKKYKDYIDKIIISVPNAFVLRNFKWALLKNSEIINTDHYFWYTPFTLWKIINEADLSLSKMSLVGVNNESSKKLISKLKARYRPILLENIVAVCMFKNRGTE